MNAVNPFRAFCNTLLLGFCNTFVSHGGTRAKTTFISCSFQYFELEGT